MATFCKKLMKPKEPTCLITRPHQTSTCSNKQQNLKTCQSHSSQKCTRLKVKVTE